MVAAIPTDPSRLSSPVRLRAWGIALALALGLCISATGCSSSSVMHLSVGDCLMMPTGDTVTNITTKECTEAHDSEVIAAPIVEGDVFPGSDALDREAEERCLAQFAQYVGTDYETSTLELTWLIPTQESWERNDDREIICLATTPDSSTLTTSVRDSRL